MTTTIVRGEHEYDVTDAVANELDGLGLIIYTSDAKRALLRDDASWAQVEVVDVEVSQRIAAEREAKNEQLDTLTREIAESSLKAEVRFILYDLIKEARP